MPRAWQEKSPLVPGWRGGRGVPVHHPVPEVPLGAMQAGCIKAVAVTTFIRVLACLTLFNSACGVANCHERVEQSPASPHAASRFFCLIVSCVTAPD